MSEGGGRCDNLKVLEIERVLYYRASARTGARSCDCTLPYRTSPSKERDKNVSGEDDDDNVV